MKIFQLRCQNLRGPAYEPKQRRKLCSDYFYSIAVKIKTRV